MSSSGGFARNKDKTPSELKEEVKLPDKAPTQPFEYTLDLVSNLKTGEIPASDKVYLQEKNGYLLYTLKTTKGLIVRDVFLGITSPQPFTLETLDKIKEQILNHILTPGHLQRFTPFQKLIPSQHLISKEMVKFPDFNLDPHLFKYVDKNAVNLFDDFDELKKLFPRAGKEVNLQCIAELVNEGREIRPYILAAYLYGFIDRHMLISLFEFQCAFNDFKSKEYELCLLSDAKKYDDLRLMPSNLSSDTDYHQILDDCKVYLYKKNDHIAYKAITPNNKIVDVEFKDIPAPEPFTLDKLNDEHKQKILEAATKAAHIHSNFKHGILYLHEKDSCIAYTAIAPTGILHRDVKLDIPAPHPFTLEKLTDEQKKAILKAASKAGHTQLKIRVDQILNKDEKTGELNFTKKAEEHLLPHLMIVTPQLANASNERKEEFKRRFLKNLRASKQTNNFMMLMDANIFDVYLIQKQLYARISVSPPQEKLLDAFKETMKDLPDWGLDERFFSEDTGREISYYNYNPAKKLLIALIDATATKELLPIRYHNHFAMINMSLQLDDIWNQSVIETILGKDIQPVDHYSQAIPVFGDSPPREVTQITSAGNRPIGLAYPGLPWISEVHGLFPAEFATAKHDNIFHRRNLIWMRAINPAAYETVVQLANDMRAVTGLDLTALTWDMLDFDNPMFTIQETTIITMLGQLKPSFTMAYFNKDTHPLTSPKMMEYALLLFCVVLKNQTVYARLFNEANTSLDAFFDVPIGRRKSIPDRNNFNNSLSPSLNVFKYLINDYWNWNTENENKLNKLYEKIKILEEKKLARFGWYHTEGLKLVIGDYIFRFRMSSNDSRINVTKTKADQGEDKGKNILFSDNPKWFDKLYETIEKELQKMKQIDVKANASGIGVFSKDAKTSEHGTADDPTPKTNLKK